MSEYKTLDKTVAYSAAAKTASLRSTIPRAVCTLLGIEARDHIEWAAHQDASGTWHVEISRVA